MNSHKRQSSTGSFGVVDQNHIHASFANLDRFMYSAKLMQDEIMVPSKLKDHIFKDNKSLVLEQIETEVPANPNEETIESCANHSTDVLDHYKFILLIRDQFLKPDPFKNSHADFKCKKFKTIFDNLEYHYSQMMNTFDSLTNEAKEITTIYKENV